MKTGRNEPCPCGSGLKYKKCCLPRDEQPAAGPGARTVPAAAALATSAAAAAVPPPRYVSPSPFGREGCGFSPGLIAAIIESRGYERRWRELKLSPYAVAKIRVDDRGVTDPELRRAVARHRRGWTIERVAALSTGELEERLSRLGIAPGRERFRELAETRFSAWTIADEWTASDTFGGSDGDIDFADLAACELWRRLLPERPSIEMLDDWMQEGYDLAAARREPAACDVWWRLWEVLHSRFTPAMRTTEQAGPLFSGLQGLGNWLQDFELHVGNAAQEDRRYVVMGRQFCEEWMRQFTDESADEQVSFRRALATFLFDLGQPGAALALLQAVIADWPHNPWGYIDLADAYMHEFPRSPGIPRDLAAARRWLERGRAAARNDRQERAALEERLAWLRKEERR